MIKVHVVTGNRGKFVLRWTDAEGKQRQRTVDIVANSSNRSKAYKLASTLEAELSGDAVPDLMLEKRNRKDETPRNLDPKVRAYFQESHLDGLSADYIDTMNAILSRFEKFANPKSVKDVTSSKVRMWFASLRAEKLADSTIQTYWRHLHAFLSIAADDYIIDEIPRVRTPKSKAKMKGRPITLERNTSESKPRPKKNAALDGKPASNDFGLAAFGSAKPTESLGTLRSSVSISLADIPAT